MYVLCVICNQSHNKVFVFFVRELYYEVNNFWFRSRSRLFFTPLAATAAPLSHAYISNTHVCLTPATAFASCGRIDTSRPL